MRCPRCNSCMSQWNDDDCRRCAWPWPDKRTPEQQKQDEEEDE